jgi:hypothetical protein
LVCVELSMKLGVWWSRNKVLVLALVLMLCMCTVYFMDRGVL